MPRYRVIRYDTWGNVDDGWDVNNAFSRGTVDVHVNAPHEAYMIAFERATGTGPVEEAEQDAEGAYEFSGADGEPLGRLEAAGRLPVSELTRHVFASMRGLDDVGSGATKDVDFAYNETADGSSTAVYPLIISDGQPDSFVHYRLTWPERDRDGNVMRTLSQSMHEALAGEYLGVDMFNDDVSDLDDKAIEFLQVALDYYLETGKPYPHIYRG